MRELVLTCAFAMLGAGCVEVVSHRDEFDAGPDIVMTDATAEPEVNLGQCVSGVRWGGGTPSQVHNPGKACLASGCHSPTSKTPMTLGGTVYPLKGEHDDDDCYGIDPTMGGVGVEILDMDGMSLNIPRLQVNGSGNFYTAKALPPAYRVVVHSGGRQARQMTTVSNGDCNYCHRKEDFMGAKGRIVPAPP
jgi:hypothetical protein